MRVCRRRATAKGASLISSRMKFQELSVAAWGVPSYHHVTRLESGIHLLPSKLQPSFKSFHGGGEYFARVNQTLVYLTLAVFADRQAGIESSGSYFGCTDLDDVTLVKPLNPVSEISISETHASARIVSNESPPTPTA